jgi:hypothetical protein
METFLQKPEEKKSRNTIFLAAIGIGLVFVLIFIGLISLKSSTYQIQTQALDGAFREGTPEFERYTKKIIAETDENNTMQSPTGLGTITMSIRGKIRNITGKPLTGLELKVTVIDSFGNPVKEKTTVVIPKEDVTRLENGQILPVQVTIEGFSKEDDRANIRWKVTAIKVQE